MASLGNQLAAGVWGGDHLKAVEKSKHLKEEKLSLKSQLVSLSLLL